jgi:hypothetical protein
MAAREADLTARLADVAEREDKVRSPYFISNEQWLFAPHYHSSWQLIKPQPPTLSRDL